MKPQNIAHLCLSKHLNLKACVFCWFSTFWKQCLQEPGWIQDSTTAEPHDSSVLGGSEDQAGLGYNTHQHKLEMGQSKSSQAIVPTKKNAEVRWVMLNWAAAPTSIHKTFGFCGQVLSLVGRQRGTLLDHYSCWWVWELGLGVDQARHSYNTHQSTYE